MSAHPLVSPGTRSVARLRKATVLPSAEIEGRVLSLFPCSPAEVTLTRRVCPLARSCTKTSEARLVSPGTSVVARLSKATSRPSAESAGYMQDWSGSLPPTPRLARTVVPAWRSCTKTSTTVLVIPGTRFRAWLPKATLVPSAEMHAL